MDSLREWESDDVTVVEEELEDEGEGEDGGGMATVIVSTRSLHSCA